MNINPLKSWLDFREQVSLFTFYNCAIQVNDLSLWPSRWLWMARCFSAPCRWVASLFVPDRCCGASWYAEPRLALSTALHFTQYFTRRLPVYFDLYLITSRSGEWSNIHILPSDNFIPRRILSTQCVFFFSSRRSAINGECLCRFGGGFVSLPDRGAQASGFHSTLARRFSGKHKAAVVLLDVSVLFCFLT